MSAGRGVELGGRSAWRACKGIGDRRRGAGRNRRPGLTLTALRDILAGWRLTSAIRALASPFRAIMLDRADDGFGRLMGTRNPAGRVSMSAASRMASTQICDRYRRQCAALAEWRWGGGVGLDVLAYLTSETGSAVACSPTRMVHGLLHPEMGHVMVRRIAGDDFPASAGSPRLPRGLASGPAIAAAPECIPRDAGGPSSLANRRSIRRRDAGQSRPDRLAAAHPDRRRIG